MISEMHGFYFLICDANKNTKGKLKFSVSLFILINLKNPRSVF